MGESIIDYILMWAKCREGTLAQIVLGYMSRGNFNMKIAVLMGGLRFDSQRRIIDGLCERAREDGGSVYAFTCDVWSYSASGYKEGQLSIFNLPDFKSFDGVILHEDTFYEPKTIDKLVRRIRKSGIPCISLDNKYEGMQYIGIENFTGIYEITNHMINEHGAKYLNFISGPEGNAHSAERMRAYRKALQDNGIPFEKERIAYGDYHPGGGERAVAAFLKSDLPFPDAIIAANDEMAMGAFRKLREEGISVPEQVKLSGYDNTFVARNHVPKITSVKRPDKELGKHAYDKLKAILQGQAVNEEETLLCQPIFTESCGCQDKVKEKSKDLRERYVKEKLHATSYSEIIRSSSADFTGSVTLDELLDKIRMYLGMIDIKEFYLCMCTNNMHIDGEVMSQLNTEAVLPDVTTYTDEMYIPLAYRNGKFLEYGNFPVNKLLPDEWTGKNNGDFYTVLPLHYQQRCYGYCVLCNSRLMLDSEMFHLFIMNINNALENLRKQSMLNAMVDRLNRMWVYDTLTGVFNRAGFFKYAPNIIKEACEKKNDLFVLFLDLDGLKTVNDKYGHDEGDVFIKAMASVLNQVHRHGELLMRYGGDEFVVMAQGYSHEDARKYIDQIQTGMENYNSVSDHPYVLDASMGYAIVPSSEKMDLDELIEKADKEMYKVKKEKKGRRTS